MNSFSGGVTFLIAGVICYFCLAAIGKRFFIGRFRAEVAAAATVLACLAGLCWPFFVGRFNSGAPLAAIAVPSVVAPQAPVAVAIDAERLCSTASISQTAGKGSVDTISVKTDTANAPAAFRFHLQPGDVVLAQGWAAKLDLTAPAAAVCVVVDSRIVPGVSVSYGQTRTDVAGVFHNDALATSGFLISLPAERLMRGSHRIAVVAVNANGSAAFLPGSVRLAGP